MLQITIIRKIKLKSNLYRYNGIVSSMCHVVLGKTNLYKGFIPLSGVAENIEYVEVEDFEISSIEERYLIDLVEQCRENEISLVFAISPCGERNLAFESWIKKFCETYKVLLLEEGLDDKYIKHSEWFMDVSHLNDIGATHYSERIAELLLDYRRNNNEKY